MKRFLERTWVATLVMVIIVVAFDAVVAEPIWIAKFGIAALLTSPPVWWWLIARRTRPGIITGAWAGAVIGAGTQLLFDLPQWIWYFAIHGTNGLRQEGGLVFIAVASITLTYAWVAALLCGGAGALIVLFQGQREGSALVGLES